MLKFWKGGHITKLPKGCVFVFGSNPEGRHGAGAAKAAMSFGAKLGQGRGMMGCTYGLVTKNLTSGFTEPNGRVYVREGMRSVTIGAIVSNIQELYEVARSRPDQKFLIAYTNEGVTNLNGYTSEEMYNMFVCMGNVPSNVYIHESYAKMAGVEGYVDGFVVEPMTIKKRFRKLFGLGS
ncbi:hypothetical protein NVP1244A_096 [Vibrio phage 1.244.A._10N.261.54.C3]|nr:hypothetical protein NVP1244A_096 [Vibrio phage 1.244.A._10N.261.54.C3]AUR98724.1 hypothetical protein NVP1255O_096 [Vibrio phage 1.255.O._10N.286.45.F1]